MKKNDIEAIKKNRLGCRECYHYYSYEHCKETGMDIEISEEEFLCGAKNDTYIDENIKCKKFI